MSDREECRHLQVIPCETIHAETDRKGKAAMWYCGWQPEPESLPPWLVRSVHGGVQPERDCATCPCWAPVAAALSRPGEGT